MRLRLFAGFHLADARGRPVAVPLKRARALIAFLAAKETRSEERETLVDLLWPDRFRKQAQASLRQVLFELKKAAGTGPALVAASRSTVSLGPAINECDLWAFEALTTGGGMEHGDRLLDIFAGPFLDGPALGPEPFRQWCAIQRARLEGKLETAVLDAVAGFCEGEADDAARTLERLVSACPMCCQAVLQLMQIEARRGNTVAAMRAFERYQRRLSLEFDDRPPSELDDLYKALKTTPRMALPMRGDLRRPAYQRRDPWSKTRGDAPVVAVLPFRFQGRHPEGGALALALGEDITLMLSGCRWFAVLSSAATHGVGTREGFIPKDFARLTGADYLVYGAISERAEGLSLTVELAHAETGYIGWARRYDADGTQLRSWAGEICPLIVAALDPAVAESERMALARPALAATSSETAYRHLVNGYRHFYGGAFGEALDAFARAVEEDKTYAHAHAMLAVTTYLGAQVTRGKGWETALAEAKRRALRALEIDPSEAKACNIVGQTLDWQGRHDEAPEFLDRAVGLNPSFSLASTARSYHAVMTGDFDRAHRLLQTAMRLRVGDGGLGLCLPSKALAELHLGRRGEALETAHWAVRLRPRFWLGRQVLAATLWTTGKRDAARRMVASLREDYQGLSGDEFADWFPYAHGDHAAPVKQALRDAGWA